MSSADSSAGQPRSPSPPSPATQHPADPSPRAALDLPLPADALAADSSSPPNPSVLRHRTAGQQSHGGRPFSERRRSSILVGQRSVDLLMEKPGEPGPRFVLFVIRFYRRWGYYVADHDWQAISVCLLISLVGLYFTVTTPQQNDITGYAPFGARARVEYSRYQEFFSRDGPGITVYIFALARDDGSMLREDYLAETVKVLNLANENVTMWEPEKGQAVSFSQFCHSFCKLNEPVRAFYNGFKVQNDLTRSGKHPNSRIALNYPIAQIFGRAITLQQSFFGIEYYNDSMPVVGPREQGEFNVTAALLSAQLDEEEGGEEGMEQQTPPNGTELSPATGQREGIGGRRPPRVTNMKEVKMVVLQFRAEHQTGWTEEQVKAYEMAMVDRFEGGYQSELLKLYVLSNSYVETEMVRAGISMLPYLTVGFLVMVVCSVCSVLLRAIYLHQHSLPKILLAIAACILPFMSCATALGFMFLFGMRFASLLCVIPFLVLSIGVDSSYLMIHEWQQVIKHCRQQPNRKNSNVGYRISQVLSEVGPAILISTLTNIFADGCGAWTSSPELRRLCLGNMVAMMIAFVYQMTFYAGLMSIVGRYEIENEKRERQLVHQRIQKPIDSSGNNQSNSDHNKNGMAGTELGGMANGGNKHKELSRQQSKFHEHTKHYMSETILLYVNLIANRAVALATIGLYFVYLALSILGITRIDINLSTQKLFTQDSPLLELDKLRVDYQVPHFMMATVFVNRPGNLSNPARLGRMNQFVADMERINGSWGPVGTQYFVRDFITFETNFEGDTDPDELAELGGDIEGPPEGTNEIQASRETPTGPFHDEDLAAFERWPEYTHWGGFLMLDNKTGHLQRFFFTTGYHGQQLKVWTERGKLLNQWRAVVDKYSNEFDATVFHEDAVFLDLIDNMPTDTWQSVLGTLVCMALVCFLFLNSLFTVVIASSCVLSICCGILGILSWWGIDLDPITMAAMIISIGFSVDIPAHVSYHYYQASIREFEATPQMKLVNCLSSVAFPALQAALSTTLCVCSLLFVRLYMAEVFVKTMVLCVALCNLHGLVFLPAFLIVFDWLGQSCLRGRRQQKKGGKERGHPIRPSVIQEEGSQESSLRENGGRVQQQKRTAEGGHQQQQNGGLNGQQARRAGQPMPAEQSWVTDRPKLERFCSIEEPEKDAEKEQKNKEERREAKVAVERE